MRATIIRSAAAVETTSAGVGEEHTRAVPTGTESVACDNRHKLSREVRIPGWANTVHRPSERKMARRKSPTNCASGECEGLADQTPAAARNSVERCPALAALGYPRLELRQTRTSANDCASMISGDILPNLASRTAITKGDGSFGASFGAPFPEGLCLPLFNTLAFDHVPFLQCFFPDCLPFAGVGERHRQATIIPLHTEIRFLLPRPASTSR